LKILQILKFIKNNRIRNYKSISRRFRLYDYWRRTGGHTGCAAILKQHYPNLKVFAVEPEASPVISGGDPAHTLQGIGAGFIPVNLHTDLLDGTIQVSRTSLCLCTEQLKRRNVVESHLGHHWLQWLKTTRNPRKC
jgi:hypothetical protein